MKKEWLRSWRYQCSSGLTLTLALYDEHRRDEMGKSILGYILAGNYGYGEIFRGDDFHCSPLDAIDSDRAAAALLGFLGCRPGDVDEDYFKDYSPFQLDFALTYGEEVQSWAEELAPCH